MSGAAERFAAAAGALAGTPFRLHGRDPATGLDCVGLVSCALERAGIPGPALRGYALRNADIVRHLALATANGFVPARGDIARGDLILARPGPAQSHLLIVLGCECFIHAHAGLRRVALHHGPLPWPVDRHWRLARSLEE